MLTVLGSPKPAADPHTDLIQRNAIRSWQQLPEVEIILFSNDDYAIDLSIEMGLRCEPVAQNTHGTPLFSDILMSGQRKAAFESICYTNSDIILTPSFIHSIDRVFSWRSPALILGARTDFRIEEEINFHADWLGALERQVDLNGQHMTMGIDYFVFRRGMFRYIPPFALGRTTFDNWIIWKSRATGIPVIDVSGAVLAVHQDHPSRWEEIVDSIEAEENRNLAGRWKSSFTIGDATHRLLSESIDSRRRAAMGNRASVAANLLRASLRQGIRPAYHGVRSILGLKEKG